jgi:hypothetical protein
VAEAEVREAFKERKKNMKGWGCSSGVFRVEHLSGMCEAWI